MGKLEESRVIGVAARHIFERAIKTVLTIREHSSYRQREFVYIILF